MHCVHSQSGNRPGITAGSEAPAGYVELMQACWAQLPANRPTLSEIAATLRPIAQKAIAEAEASGFKCIRAKRSVEPLDIGGQSCRSPDSSSKQNEREATLQGSQSRLNNRGEDIAGETPSSLHNPDEYMEARAELLRQLAAAVADDGSSESENEDEGHLANRRNAILYTPTGSLPHVLSW